MRLPKQDRPAYRRGRKKIIVGLTGSFGSGKTTVSSMLKLQGARVVDADKIARDLLEAPGPIREKIIKEFGRGILTPSGAIDRKKLGKIVFNDSKKLVTLNSLTHPEIKRRLAEKIKSIKSGLVILEAPLLIEAGLKGAVNKLIVVKASRCEQIKRIREKSALSKSEILKRIHAQAPLSDKVRLADFVIDNNGDLQTTRKQVEKVRDSLKTDNLKVR